MKPTLLLRILAVFAIPCIITTTVIAHTPKAKRASATRKTKLQSRALRIPAKPWNFMVYMCNNNNLHRFGLQNFRQMVSAGSSENMNLLLQMDELGESQVTRFVIEKNNAIIADTQSNTPTSFSGTPGNLLEFAQWATQNYPSAKNCLVLWNHGAGIKDPAIWGRVIMRWRDDLYHFSHITGMLELNRKLAQNKQWITQHERGIAFNEVAEAYLTNEDLKRSLDTISSDMLGRKKIDIVAMDACFMAMVEIGSQLKSSVKIMVASEEVEPGSGYNYVSALAPLQISDQSPIDFATNIVSAYEREYSSTLSDYTQSAVDLSYMPALETNLDALAQQLVAFINKGGNSAMRLLKDIRNSWALTTEFYDSDYVDLNHFLQSLATKMHDVAAGAINWGMLAGSSQAAVPAAVSALASNIESTAIDGMALIKTMVIANASGRALQNAKGLAIYFPTRAMHPSYLKTEFAKATKWPDFLNRFLRTRKELTRKAPLFAEQRPAPGTTGKKRLKPKSD